MARTVPRIILPVVIITFVTGWLFGRVTWRDDVVPPPSSVTGSSSDPIDHILPAEFEPHDALLLSYIDEQEAHELMCDAIEAVHENIDIVMLVPDDYARRRIQELLSERDTPVSDLTFVNYGTNNAWVRDYGPLVVRSRSGRPVIVKTQYGVDYYPGKEFADQAPELLARELGISLINAPLVMENGNVLSNGAGLCATTRKLIAANAKYGYNEADLARKFRSYFGAGQVVLLDAIDGERNGHIDMFATFTGPDSIVVGQLPDYLTSGNARILDQNAARLAEVQTGFGPLKVHRIPMPVPDGKNWFTYTNVVYANGVLLVPHYDTVDRAIEEEALAVYRRLLPGWRIVSLDCSGWITNGGALHCAIMTVNRLPRKMQPVRGSATD